MNRIDRLTSMILMLQSHRVVAYSHDWLAAWILGQGTGVKACSPDEFREKVILSEGEEVTNDNSFEEEDRAQGLASAPLAATFK